MRETESCHWRRLTTHTYIARGLWPRSLSPPQQQQQRLVKPTTNDDDDDNVDGGNGNASSGQHTPAALCWASVGPFFSLATHCRPSLSLIPSDAATIFPLPQLYRNFLLIYPSFFPSFSPSSLLLLLLLFFSLLLSY